MNPADLIISVHYWNCGTPPSDSLAVLAELPIALYPVCAVLINDPHVGLKAYIGGSDSKVMVANRGARLRVDQAKAIFPAYASRMWADW